MHDYSLLAAHVEMLAQEVREDTSRIAEFERQNGFEERFLDYYNSYLAGERRATRTLNAAVARRRPILEFVRRLKERFGPEPVVLDIGCRYGNDSFLMAQLGCRVIGVEREPDTVEVARHRVEYWREHFTSTVAPEFVVGYLEDIGSFAGEEFHGVFAAECLHHCEPVENVLLAARRLIHDRGIACVLESNAANPAVVYKRNQIVKGTPRRRLWQDGDVFRIWGNENIRWSGQWSRIFRDCGFEITRQIFSRHLLSELTADHKADQMLCRLPGARFASIHVAYELAPVELGPADW